MALVGESQGQADFGNGYLGLQHLLARSTQTQAMHMFSDPLTHAPSENAREMHRMDSGLAAEFVECQALRIFDR
jgi:hypothetical protein